MKNDYLRKKIQFGLLGSVVLITAIALFAYSSLAKNISHLETSRNLPDLSGLVWLKDDLFLGVHDTKSLKENEPRVSLISLPQSSEGITWRSLNIDWKSVGGIAMDLESITRIPETNFFIFAESGNYKKHRGRLFLMEFKDSSLKPVAVTNWPENIINIEAIAAAKINNKLYFFYAERGADQPSTNICWTTLSLDPFRIGDCYPTQFSTPDPTPHIRQISDLAIDTSGNIYIASAFDPNQDNGPFKSSVWKIGNVESDQAQLLKINLLNQPINIAKVDGLKIESLAIRPIKNQEQEIFIGTDDENYGGVIRLLPTVIKGDL